MNNLWPTDTLAHVECGYNEVSRMRFLANADGEAITEQRYFVLSTTLVAVGDVVAGVTGTLDPKGKLFSALRGGLVVQHGDIAFTLIEQVFRVRSTGANTRWQSCSTMTAKCLLCVPLDLWDDRASLSISVSKRRTLGDGCGVEDNGRD